MKNLKETLANIKPKTLTAIIVAVGVGGIVLTYGAGNLFGYALKTVFASSGEKLQQEFVQNLKNAQEATAQLCATEKSLAKEKMANYYNDTIKLSDEDKARLTEKAEGRNLDCFILAAQVSQ